MTPSSTTPAIFALSLLLIASLTGCKSGQLANPNDEARIAEHPQVMKRNLDDAWERLDRWVKKGRITDQERKQEFEALAKKYAKVIDDSLLTPEDAWMYGDVLRTAGDWKRAAEVFDRARKKAPNEDRRVNDSLRYARCAAHLGKMTEALEAARSTFTAPPAEKAPIMMAVLYEIIPEARGKKRDAELAKLLEDAIKQHLQAEVDPSTKPGKDFLAARPVHVQNAWSTVVALYQSGGQPGEARRAISRADDILRRYSRV